MHSPTIISWRLLLLAALVLNGCVSMSTMQTARPLIKDRFAGLFGLGFQSLVITKGGSDNGLVSEKTIESVRVPILEAGFRYGLLDNADVGLKYTIPGVLTGDIKYGLSGENSPMATAVGAGVGYGTFSVGDSKYSIIDLNVPFYLSYDVSDTFSYYGATRVYSRSVTSDDDKSSSVVIGLGGGISYHWLVAEFSYFVAPGAQEYGGIQQVMVGYWGGWDDVKKPWSTQPSLPDGEEPVKIKKTKKKKKQAKT